MNPTVVFEVASQDSKMISRIAELATHPAGIFEVKSMHSVVDGLIYFNILTSYEPMDFQALIDNTEVAELYTHHTEEPGREDIVQSLRNVTDKQGNLLAKGTWLD